MILVILAVISLVVALIRKGSFANLFDSGIKAPYLFIVSILLFVALEVGDGASISLIQNYAYVIMLVAYIVLLLSVVLNFNNFWMIPLLLGVILNFVVIFLNGGKMPISASMMQIAGVSAETVAASSTMSVADAGTSLSFLGGIVPIPLPWLFASVVSPGTLLIGVGMFAVIQNLMLGIVYEYEEDEEEEYEEDEDDEAVEEDEPKPKKKRGIFGKKKDEEQFEFDGDEDDEEDSLVGKNYADEDIELDDNASGFDILDSILGRDESEIKETRSDTPENDKISDEENIDEIDFDESEFEKSFTGSLSGIDSDVISDDDTAETETTDIAKQATEDNDDLDERDIFSIDDENEEKPELFGFEDMLEGDLPENDTEEETDDSLFDFLDEDNTSEDESAIVDDVALLTPEKADDYVNEDFTFEVPLSEEDTSAQSYTENVHKNIDVLKRADEVLDNIVYEKEEDKPSVASEPQMPIDVDSPYIIVNSRIVANPYYKFRKGEPEIVPESGEDMAGGVYVMKTRNPSTVGKPSFSPPSRTVNQSEGVDTERILKPQSIKKDNYTVDEDSGYEKVEMNIGDVQIRFWKKDNEEND